MVLLFIMGLVVASLVEFDVPCNSRFAVIVTLALGARLATSLLGGLALAEGKFADLINFLTPVQFSVGGGVAVIVIMLILGNFLYVQLYGA